jgi:hypothetical protein
MCHITAKNCLHFDHILRLSEFKVDRLINKAEVTSRQHSIHAVLSILLAAFGQINNENQEQKAKKKDLKNLQLDQKRSVFKVGAKEGVDAEDITTIKRRYFQSRL